MSKNVFYNSEQLTVNNEQLFTIHCSLFTVHCTLAVALYVFVVFPSSAVTMNVTDAPFEKSCDCPERAWLSFAPGDIVITGDRLDTLSDFKA